MDARSADGQIELRVELLKRRVIPFGDLAEVDIGEGRAVEHDVARLDARRIFTTATMPPITIGHCARPALVEFRWLSGASVAPKVTVFALICLMPPPDPID